MRRAETRAMADVSACKAHNPVAAVGPSGIRKSSGTFSIKRQTGFGAVAMFCFFLLYLPIATLVVYSFNAGPSVAVWEGFSWRWYVAAWNNAQIIETSTRSFIIAS